MNQLSQMLLKQLPRLFEAEKEMLAYIALTGKLELQVRDRLAYQLHTVLPEGYAVLREWKRRDLAVFKDDSLKLLVELKAAFAFDLVRSPGATNDFGALLLRDLEKCRDTALQYGHVASESLALLIVVNPHSVVPARWGQHMKYVSRKDAERELRSMEQVVAAAQQRISDIEQMAHGVWPGGRAFDTSVDVAYWLFRDHTVDA